MNKKIIAMIIIICLIVGLILYIKKDNSSKNIVLDNINKDAQILPNSIISNSDELYTNDIQISNDYIERGNKENKGFIVDNILHSKIQGDIHFSSYVPNDYNKSKKYAIYFALPGWEGLYFQGIGANLLEPFPFEAQKYNKDMIIISPQLDDWDDKSANDCIALVEYFLENYNIDKSKVYLSGVSGGGETLSIILGKKPEIFTAALYVSSKWDGKLEVLANSKTPLYMVIGENDSYYGSTETQNAYNSLYKLYKQKGLTESEINEILVLDIKKHSYFTSKGYSDEHAGCISFAYEEDIMKWIFSK